MDHSIPTTSFGRRPATLGQIAAQLALGRAIDEAALPGSNAPAAVNKWQLFRTLTEIRERLGISDRTLSVLNALLSFHPEVALSLPRPVPDRSAAQDPSEASEPPAPCCDLVVFPSNRALSSRAHGMAERTLLRHITDLVGAGLIVRRDSPNGKRYARKAGAGQALAGQTPSGHAEARFAQAFGFDLTPLVARAREFEALAEEVQAQRRQRQLLKERISLLRRDVGKLIELGLDEGLPGDWEALGRRAMGMMTPLRRIRENGAFLALEADLASLRAEIAKLLESYIEAKNLSGNDGQHGAHQSNSKTQYPSEFEPASKEDGGEAEASGPSPEAPAAAPKHKSYPLGMVLEACPDLTGFAPRGRIASWPEFLETARLVRPMLGISPDAWVEARKVLGEAEAHIAVAAILQRSEHSSEARAERLADGGLEIQVNGSPAIRSAGGYLRALTDKAGAGEVALGPLLMALIGQRLKARRAAHATP